jgi:hypothetical protein
VPFGQIGGRAAEDQRPGETHPANPFHSAWIAMHTGSFRLYDNRISAPVPALLGSAERRFTPRHQPRRKQPVATSQRARRSVSRW